MSITLTPISTTSNLITDDRAAQHPQLSALRTSNAAAFAALLAAASGMVRDHCKRDFNAADHTEYLSGGNYPYDSVTLSHFPVLSVSRVATNPVTAITVRNADPATNQRATVATTVAGLTLARVASGIPATDAVDYATYPTLAALVAAVVALGNGWTAAAAADYALFPSADLRPLQGAVTCRNADAGLEIYAEDVPSLPFSAGTADPAWWGGDPAWRLDAAAGILVGRFPQGRMNVRVDYRAGYDVVPEPVQQACVDLAADLLGLQQINGSFTSVRVGPFAAEMAEPARQLLRSPKIAGPLSYYVDHSKIIGGRLG